MKILIANTLYYPDMVGGAEVSTQILAEKLVKYGVDVTVVCATGTGSDRVSEVNGVKVYYLRLANLYWPYQRKKHSRVARLIWHSIDTRNFLMAIKLKRILADEKPEVVSTSNLTCLSVDLWRIAKQASIPTVHTLRDYYLICPTSKMVKEDRSCARQCGLCARYSNPKKVSESVDVVVGVSQFILAAHLDNGFFAKRSASTVIGDCYLPLSQQDLPVRATREAPMAATLGILGRVAPEKGIESLIETLLTDQTLAWRLVIGGSGDISYMASLKASFPDPRIEFLGHVDPCVFLQSIDVLIVPSKWNEPFGRVTVEAYSYGVPVVGANTGGIRRSLIRLPD